MDSIAVYARDEDQAIDIIALLPEGLAKSSTQHIISPKTPLLDFFKYEIPELAIMVLEENQDLREFFTAVEKDPWLTSIGFIIIAPQVDDDLIDRYRGYNIAYFLEKNQVLNQLTRVVEILQENNDLLNHAGLIQKITDLFGEIILDTDILQVNFFASLFSNFLYKEGYLGREKKLQLHLCLSELLLNAMEHGNAGISFKEKSEYLSKRFSIRKLVEQKMALPENQGKKVKLAYKISPEQSMFTITDQGNGFNVTQVLSTGVESSSVHGRGVFLSQQSSDELKYNPKGNEVTFTMTHDGKAERVIPRGFEDRGARNFDSGEVVFRENENGDALYYIVSGEYEVQIQGQAITRVTASDIFLGEMSFLLGNRRSATVSTVKQGKLVEIDRAYFTEVVKNYPEYGIFLSKLLARRLRDANLRYVGLVKNP